MHITKTHPSHKCLLSLGLSLLSLSCAADPEDSSPGSCSLNCSKKKVGAVEYSARPLLPETGLAIKCSLQGAQNGVLPHNGPLQVRFLVYEKVPSFTKLPETPSANGGGAGGRGAGGGGGGGNLTPIFSFQTKPDADKSSLQMIRLEDAQKLLQEGPLVEILPKPGIGFEPALYGSVSIANTNQEFKTGPNEATPFKFAGVVTPSSEWCTDSCGVATYEFWPNCITGGQSVQAGIYIQNTSMEATYSFNMEPI